MRRFLLAMLLAVIVVSIIVCSIVPVYAEDNSGNIPAINIVVKPYPFQANVGESAKLELYLSLDSDINGSFCIDVVVDLDKSSFVLDRGVLIVEGIYVNELGNATERYCGWASGGVWGYDDKYIYIRISAANVSKGVHKFAEILFTPIKRGEYYMIMTVEIEILNLTTRCYDNWCYRVLETIDRSKRGGYIPIVVTNASTENIVIATAGALLGFCLSLTLQSIVPQRQQYWILFGALTVLASLVILLYLLGLPVLLTT